MKVTVRKLSRMGLNKDQIKEILNISEEKYVKYVAQCRAVEVEDLPSKLDYFNKGGNVSDYRMVNIFNKIYEVNSMEVLDIEPSKKIEIIKEFPGFIKYIELKKLSDKITGLNIEKENLINKEKEIDVQIDLLKVQISSMNSEKKAEERKQSEVPTYIVGENIKIYNTYKNGSMRVHIKDFNSSDIKPDDYIDIANSEGIKRYQISNSKDIKTIQYVRFDKIVLEKREV